MKGVIFDFELKRYLLLMDLFNNIGKILSPKVKQDRPKGVLHYLDFDYRTNRPVIPVENDIK